MMFYVSYLDEQCMQGYLKTACKWIVQGFEEFFGVLNEA